VETVRTIANRKRSRQLTMLKRKNIKLAKDIEDYMERLIGKNRYDVDCINEVNTLIKRLNQCAINTLYEIDSFGKIKLMSPLICNHRLCNICNWHRQKSIRRKYIRFFQNNQTLCRVMRIKPMKRVPDKKEFSFCTHSQLDGYLNRGFVLLSKEVEYDLMHLVLTVPHTEGGGWHGSDIYIKEIINTFHQLRRLKFWNLMIYGGEYGVETTLNDNGFHTHIHALLMVAKAERNRDKLHYQIFYHWNRLTADENSKRKQFENEHFEKIIIGNRLFNDVYLKSLDPKGSTIIHLRSVYYKELINGKWKNIEYKQFGDDAMIRGVMETISYHFKPKAFQKYIELKNRDGSVDKIYTDDFDVEKIVKILPKLYKERLYNRFGVLENEPTLAIKENAVEEDFEETTEEFDSETGEVFQNHYFVTHPLNVYHKRETNEIMLSSRADVRIQTLKAHSGREAVQELSKMIVKR